MSATPTEPAPEGTGPTDEVGGPDEAVAYIRGGGGVAVDTHRAVQVVVGCLLAALAAVVIVLGIQATNQNSRMSRLQQHGVPVNVTVTGCVGLASGTGVTEAGFTCRGNFTLRGHQYNEVIGGTSDLYPPGTTLRAVVVPSEPALLSTAHAVDSAHSSWRAFITPGILLIVLLLGGGAVVWWSRRTPRTAATRSP